MKKLFLFASATVALAATSCSDDFAPGNNQANIPEGRSAIYATYPVEGVGSRTYMEKVGNKFYPRWQKGDAIGLFGNETSYVDNDSYVYSTVVSNAEEGEEVTEFVGQAYIAEGQNFFGYYPYNPAGLNDGELTMYIPRVQSFNYAMSMYQTGEDDSYTMQNGSFSQNVRPAIAYGQSLEDNQLQMSFQPIAATIKFPVVGYGTLKTATLSITESSSSGATELAGSYTITPNNVISATDPAEALQTMIGSLSNNFTPAENATQIVLNCGSGIKLNPEVPVYLWFVVPAGINLQNATVSLTANDGTVNDPQSKTVTNSITTSLTTVTNISGQTPVEVDGNTINCWNFTFGKYVISSALNFLEYAYVATNGFEDILSAWEERPNPGFSKLADMVTGYELNADGQLEASTGTPGLKPAIITQDILLTATQVKTDLQWNSSNSSIWEDLGEYYTAVYGSMLGENPYLATIGGTYQFNISGVNNYTIGGTETTPLTVKSSSSTATNNIAMFYSTNQTVDKTYTVVDNLTFDNINVIGNYFLSYSLSSANTPLAQYSDVTIGDNCSVTAPEGVSGVQNALFYVTNSNVISKPTTIPYYSKAILNKPINMEIAYRLNVIDDINFTLETTAATPNDFGQFGIYTGHPLITVANTVNDAASVIGKVQANNTNTYSVLGASESASTAPTSYWTGMTANPTIVAKAAGTAEALAYYAQEVTAAGTYPFDMVYNLNLMGTYPSNNGVESGNSHNEWWATSVNNLYSKKINVVGSTSANEISNVWIAPQASSENKPFNYQTLTLLGWQGSITGGVKINGITISNTGENALGEGVNIAAIAHQSSINTANDVTVTEYSVITEDGIVINDDLSVIGGLFGTASNLSVFGNSTLNKGSNSFADVLEGINGGYWAGSFTDIITLTDENTTSSSAVELDYSAIKTGAFGVINVSLQVAKDLTSGAYIILKTGAGITVNDLAFNVTVPTGTTADQYKKPNSGWNLSVKTSAESDWVTYEYDADTNTFSPLN